MSSLLLGLAVTVAIAQLPATPKGLANQRTSEPTVPVPAVPLVPGSTEPTQPSAPFQKLFTTSANEARRQEHQRQAIEQSAPKIVCGMVVLRADPAVDPKMIVRPPVSTTTMHIRKIPPPACAE